jgi:hypothetical protein
MAPGFVVDGLVDGNLETVAPALFPCSVGFILTGFLVATPPVACATSPVVAWRLYRSTKPALRYPDPVRPFPSLCP